MTFNDPLFWVALMQIIGVNIVLSGDNAVVIALAARSLPPKQQKQAIIWGSGAAVVMRIILTIVALELLRLPYLKLVGAALLLWIGIQLLVPEDDEGGAGASANAGMIAAIRTILIADLVMSLDNVIGVAAAAKGNVTLLVLGLLISIPLVIFGSTLLMKLMERWPIIVTIGAALLGWVAGEMAATDPLLASWVDANASWLHWGAPILGAVIVVAAGKWLASRADDTDDGRPVVDLAVAGDQDAVPAATADSGAGAVPPRVLLVADDSESSLRAVGRFLDELNAKREPVAVDLLNVQPHVHRDVSNFVEEQAVKDLHHEQGMKALQPARDLLERAHVPHAVHIGVGDLAHVTTHYAKELRPHRIYLTDTERSDASALGAAIAGLNPDPAVPVTVVQ
jgi:YjbE family integral membrane protein